MIKERVHALLEKHQLRYTVDWWLSGQPFLTARGKLVGRGGKTPLLSTIMKLNRSNYDDGGTSDGRFIARMGSAGGRTGAGERHHS